MPRESPPIHADGLTLWSVLRAIAIILLLVQIYLGIGIGLLIGINDAYNRRCSLDERLTGAEVVAGTVLWPAVVVGAGVSRLLGSTQKPCPVR